MFSANNSFSNINLNNININSEGGWPSPSNYHLNLNSVPVEETPVGSNWPPLHSDQHSTVPDQRIFIQHVHSNAPNSPSLQTTLRHVSPTPFPTESLSPLSTSIPTTESPHSQNFPLGQHTPPADQVLSNTPPDLMPCHSEASASSSDSNSPEETETPTPPTPSSVSSSIVVPDQGTLLPTEADRLAIKNKFITDWNELKMVFDARSAKNSDSLGLNQGDFIEEPANVKKQRKRTRISKKKSTS